LAISEERKKELIANYRQWLEKSQAVIVTEYIGLSMKDMDNLRSRVREAGGEFHVVKNTLGKLAFEEAGLSVPEGLFVESTAVGFAFSDPPTLAKTMINFSKTSEFIKVKGGFLDSKPLTPVEIQALAELPPLPTMRSMLLGTFLAPASQLARTIAEPARQLAAVVQAFADKESPPATA
jgi:large subunit ribosomal protein L10